MAMRLRKIQGQWVAVCAAKTKAEPDDVYLDDCQDHAMRAKLSHDYRSEGFDMPVLNGELDKLMLDAEASQ